MDLTKVHLRSLFLPVFVIACLGTQVASAQEENELSGQLSLGLSQVNNANRAVVQQDEIDELQYIGTFDLAGAFYGQTIDTAYIDYSVSRVEYSEGSQPDESVLAGESGIVFGNDEGNYTFTLSHSARSFLADPGLANLSSNRDERNIFTAEGTLRTEPAKANVYSATVRGSETQFEEAVLNDSRRYTIDLGYTRNVNAITQVGAIYSNSDIDFDVGDQNDYTAERLQVFLDRRLRRLRYAIFLGGYRTELETDDRDGALARLSAEYESGSLQWSVLAERDVTDTSLGNSNSVFIPDGPGGAADPLADGRLNEQDQIERTSLLFGMSSDGLCARCRVSLNLGLEDEAFFRFTAEDARETFVNLTGTYRISRKLSLTTSVVHSQFEFTASALEDDYDNNQLRISLSFAEIIRNLDLLFSVGWLERNSVGSASYASEAALLQASYRLF